MGQANVPVGRGPTAVAVAVSVVAGVFVALQSRINGELGLALGNGALAALVSLAMGLVLISVAIVVNPSARRGLTTLAAEVSAGRLP